MASAPVIAAIGSDDEREREAELAFERLKELAFRTGFFLTVARCAEGEVVQAVQMSPQYQTCRQYGVFDAALAEIVEPRLDAGRAMGLEELQRQKSEAERIERESKALAAQRQELRSQKDTLRNAREQFAEWQRETGEALAQQREDIEKERLSMQKRAEEIAAQRDNLEKREASFQMEYAEFRHRRQRLLWAAVWVAAGLAVASPWVVVLVNELTQCPVLVR